MNSFKFKPIYVILGFLLLGWALYQSSLREANTYTAAPTVQTQRATQASPANPTPASNFTQEEKVAMEELAKIEENNAQSYLRGGIVSFVVVALVMFGIYRANQSESYYSGYYKAACVIFLMVIVLPFSLVSWTKFMMYHMNSSTEQQITNERRRMESARVEQLRAIRDNAIRREAQKRAGVSGQ